MNRNVVISVIVGLLLLGGYWLFQSNRTKTETTQTLDQTLNSTQPTKEDLSTDSAQTKTTKEFTVVGTPFKFEPSTIRVKKGDTVKIIFRNDQGFHDFVLDEFNVKTKQIQALNQETVEFTADTTGTFEYYCSVGNHRQQGMRGNLIVE